MKIMIAAGGTGGHIFPAISLANYLLSHGDEVLFISSDNNIAHEILDDLALNTKFYPMQGLSRDKSFAGLKKNLQAVNLLNKAKKQISKDFKSFNPDVCIGFGSYITYPVIKLAKANKIPTIIHEQNSYPGLVNRMLATDVDYVCYTYQTSLEYFKDSKTNPNKYIYTSNPRISEITPHQGGDYILVLGGSLGAEKLNEIAQELSLKTDELIILVSGSRYNVKSRDNLIVKSYIPDLLNVMKQAKVIITRGGATTLLECCALEKKTIVIPSPNVVCNHQMLNAQELASNGYLEYVSEEDASVDQIYKMINDDFQPQAFVNINANEKIYNLIKELNA